MTSNKFKNIVLLHKDDVFRYAYFILRNKEDAEDMTQETFIRLWKYGQNTQISSMKSWLLRVVHNLCIDKVRRRQFERSKFTPIDESYATLQTQYENMTQQDPEAELDRNELRRMLMQAIQNLPLNLRSTIILREIEGLTYKEIADILNLHLHNVKVYIHRAKKLIKKELGPYLKMSVGAGQ